jgi:hypothetical protein
MLVELLSGLVLLYVVRLLSGLVLVTMAVYHTDPAALECQHLQYLLSLRIHHVQS